MTSSELIENLQKVVVKQIVKLYYLLAFISNFLRTFAAHPIYTGLSRNHINSQYFVIGVKFKPLFCARQAVLAVSAIECQIWTICKISTKEVARALLASYFTFA